MTAYDELELDTLGDRKTALFLIMSDTDASFNFLISMIYSQLFKNVCPIRTARFTRKNRIMEGHMQTVRYIVRISV